MLRKLIGVLLCLAAARGALAHDFDRTPPADLAAVKARVAEILSAHQVPGAGFAVILPDGSIEADGAGLADVRAGRKVTAKTRFRAGSVSKSFIAAALLKLVDAGRLDLNAPVKSLAPELDIRNPWHDSDPVRVVHLLEHTAGFDDMHFRDAYNLGDPPNMPLLAAVNRGYRALTVRWRPGTRFAYSNPGYAVAGYLLQKVTGKPYEQAVADLIFAPLGLDSATLRYSGGGLENLAAGYAGSDSSIPVTNRPIYLRPAGNLVIAPRDLAVFAAMLMHRGEDSGRVMSRKAVLRMEQAETGPAAGLGIRTGHGLGSFGTVIESYFFHGHGGGIDGYLSDYGYDPEHGFGYVVMLNSSNGKTALREISHVLVSYAAQQAEPALPAVAAVTDAQLAGYAGYYRNISPRNEIARFLSYLLDVKAVHAGDGELHTDPLLGTPETFVPVNVHAFRRPDAPVASLGFAGESGGEPLMVDSHGSWERISAFGAWFPIYGLALALLALFSTLAFAPVWITRLALGHMKDVRGLYLRILPLASAVLLLLSGAILMGADLTTLATANFRSVGFTVLTVLFAVSALAAVIENLRTVKVPMHWAVRGHTLVASVGALIIAAYLGYWHIIGLRTWAW